MVCVIKMVKMLWTHKAQPHESTTNFDLSDDAYQNYNHFAAKHTHWHLQWWNHGRSHLERPKHWSLKKKGIAWHIDASSVVWTLTYKSKYADQIVITIKFTIAILHATTCQAGEYWNTLKRDKLNSSGFCIGKNPTAPKLECNALWPKW